MNLRKQNQISWHGARLTAALCLVLVLTTLTIPFRSAAQGVLGGKVRFIHAVPGAPKVDVYVDGAITANGLAFAEATRFINVQPGPHTVTVNVNGTSQTVFQGEITATVDLGITVVVQGDSSGLTAAVYEDDLAPARPGALRFTAIHAVQDAPPVDVLQVTDTVVPLAQGLTFGQPYGSVDIPANAADLIVVPAGADVTNPLIKIEKSSLISGTYTTAVIVGALSGSPAPTLVVLSEPLQAENAADAALVRLVHASSQAPNVDIYVDDTLIAPNLSFTGVTPHLALPSGEAKISLRAAGAAFTDEPVFETTATLQAGAAATVVVAGAIDALQAIVSPDRIEGLLQDQARVTIINATDGEVVFAELSESVALDSLLIKDADVPAGIYGTLLGVRNAGQVEQSLQLSGGVIYSLVIAGEIANPTVIVAASGITEAPGSAPAPQGGSVAVAPTAVAPTAEAVAGLPSATPITLPTLAPTPISLPTVAAVEPPIAVATEVVLAPAVTATPFGRSGITGRVDTNEGVNLKVYEYPRQGAKTLGLMPSGTNVRVDGVLGPEVDSNQPTPEATATLSAEGVRVDDVWVFVTWEQDDGGKIDGWTRPLYLDIRDPRGKRLQTAQELFENLQQIPASRFGTIETALATPIPGGPPPLLGTVNVDPGVNLQLRRTPDITGESLALLPAASQVFVLSRTEVGSKGGLVGEPDSLTWLFVRFQTETGAIIGWVNSEFVLLTQGGKNVKLEDVPQANEITPGGVEGNPAIAQPTPISDAVIASVDKLDAGANLQFRLDPDANAQSLGLIPAGSQLEVLGRNGAGSWLQVVFNNTVGWINSGYVSLSQRGRKLDLLEVKIVTGEEDFALTATPTPIGGN